jgi:PAS domain S-box-containing protein
MNASQDLIERGFDLLNIGVGIFDASMTLVYCNSAFKSLRRYPDDICRPGVTLTELLRYNAERGDFGPGDVDSHVSDLLAEIQAADTRERERKMADGQILGITYRQIASGGLMVSFQDRTTERTAEHALKRSEERYALISDAAEEAIYEWDIADAAFSAALRLQHLIGQDSDQRGARDWIWDDLVHPDDLDRYRDALRRHLSGEDEGWECEYRLKIADGTWRWVKDHGDSIRGPDGRAVRMIAAVRDITDRIERDAALAASEERYSLVSQSTSDGIYDWNVADDVLFVSDNLTSILDFDLSNGSSSMWVERVHPEDRDAYVATVRTHFKGESDAIEHDYRVRSKDGGYRWVHDHGVGVRDAHGRVTRLVGAVSDITEDIARVEALRASEESAERAHSRLTAVLSTISDGLLVIDAEGRVELWNDRYAEIFGDAAGGADMSNVIVKDRPFVDMIRHGYSLGMFKPFPGGADAWVEARKKAWGKPRPQIELELANGSWILQKERQMPDGARVSVYNDITKFKLREAEIQAARQRFEEAIEAITAGFSLWDADDRLVVSNARFRSFFADLADLVVPGNLYPEIVRAGLDRGLFPLATGDTDAYIADLIEKRSKGVGEAREQFVNDVWLQVTDHRTKEGGIVSIYTDITELKAKQAEIEAQTAILELTLENMIQGISLVDEHLRTTAFNSKFLELLDLPADEFQRGFTMEEAFRFNAKRGDYGAGDIEEQVQSRLDLAAKFEAHRFERQKPDGTVIEIVGNPVEGGGFVSTYTDVTELKRHEDEIIKAKDEAENALAELRTAQDRLVQSEKLASLGQLTAGIAHEIKNPLNFVNNFAKLSDELLGELTDILADPIASLSEEDRDDAEDLFQTIRENLVKINEHGRRADNIVRNMLLHSREGPSEHRMSELNPIVEEAMNLAYHGARAEDPGFNVSLEMSIDPEVGQISCYPQDLMRVFLNLFTNGLYSVKKRQETEGSGFNPMISLTTRSNGETAEVGVRDNGIGIPDDVIEKIFVPFFTTKPTGEGTGLGLSLSYDIVTKQHGGSLSVESEPNAYTTFLVSLPRGGMP